MIQMKQRYTFFMCLCVLLLLSFGGCKESPTKLNGNGNGNGEEIDSYITMITTSKQVVLSLKAIGEVTIDWGDGTETNDLLSGDISEFRHTYLDTTYHTMVLHGDITYLDCNDNALVCLDVSNSVSLLELRSQNNLLTSLDVSDNTALLLLNVSGNRFTTSNLNALFHTLHDNPGSKHIYILDNPGTADSDKNIAESKGWTVHDGFEEIDRGEPSVIMVTTSQSVALTIKTIGDVAICWGDGTQTIATPNANGKEFRHVYQNDEEHTIAVYGDVTYLDSSNIGLTSLDVSNNTSLQLLDISGNLFTALELDGLFHTLHDNPGSKHIYIFDNPGTAGSDKSIAERKGWVVHSTANIAMTTTARLARFELRGNGRIIIDWGDGSRTHDFLNADDNEYRSFGHTSLYQGARTIAIYGTITHLNCFDMRLTYLDVRNSPALQSLDCSHNYLTSLDVRNNTLLQYLATGFINSTTVYVPANRLETLDLSNNKLLRDLQCADSGLTSLDVKNNKQLLILNCANNSLTDLDVSNNKLLRELNVYYNYLASLDVSNNELLELLYCGSNSLTSLNLLNNALLRELHAGNQITSLDVSNNVLLTHLSVQESALTSLDLNKNISLRFLNVFGSPLLCLDVTTNVSLVELSIGMTQITELDLSNNVSLSAVSANDSQLTSLILGNNTRLSFLDVANNSLTSLDVSGCTGLTSLFVRNNRFDANGLNELFHTLHDRPTTHSKSIAIGGNPGVSESDMSIAEAKGWRVSTMVLP